MPEGIEIDRYVAVCADCGVAILLEEVGGELDGRFVDYMARAQGVANFVLCTSCWERFKENSNSSIEEGIERRDEKVLLYKKEFEEYL